MAASELHLETSAEEKRAFIAKRLASNQQPRILRPIIGSWAAPSQEETE